ncbi:zinc ion binding / nucleic acid binding protein [Thalictrum thalictroides]|uniref:Zinc ion binding / nucleic acid binding protein n=1 Tax=Thalictrum thalictroides TaxID=46969 RepID=A0A7J6UXG8_THATH|nr:zinc ion binding / nucleic acid binding protein [Thalictrum thalictroides]
MSDLWKLGGGRNSIPLKGLEDKQQLKLNDQVCKVSYADKVKKLEQPVVEYSELPEPGFRDEYPTIKLPKRAYERGLEYCKFSLIARLDMQVVSLDELKKQVGQIWGVSAPFTITPLGKGFLHLKFENCEDYQKVWIGGPWKIGNELLRLQKWEKNFRPENQKRTNALIWIRLPNLPMECWDVESLLSIGRGVGYSMKVDETSLNKQFGYYANVLVDVDLTKPIPNQVLVTTEDYEFWQDIVVTKMPKFCNHCKVVGHLVTECRKLKGTIDKGKGVVEDKTPPEQTEKTEREWNNRRRNKNKKGTNLNHNWVQKSNLEKQKDLGAETVHQVNRFQALEEEEIDVPADKEEEMENQIVVAENDKQLAVVVVETNEVEMEPFTTYVDLENEHVEHEDGIELTVVLDTPLDLQGVIVGNDIVEQEREMQGIDVEQGRKPKERELIDQTAEVALQLVLNKTVGAKGSSSSMGNDMPLPATKKEQIAAAPVTRSKAVGK